MAVAVLGEPLLKDLHDESSGGHLQRNPDSVEKTRQEFADSGLTVHSYACDVQSPADIEACVAQVIQDHGRIDTLVNVAGVNRRKRAETVTVDDYDFILDTNLRAHSSCARKSAAG